MGGDTLAAAYCPACLIEYRAGFEICADCGTPLEPGPAPEEPERGEVELVRAPTPPPEVEQRGVWDEATARVWGEGPFEPNLDDSIDVDEEDVDVDETGYALVMVSPALTAYEGAERLAEAGIDARVVMPESLPDRSPATGQAEVRVPWDRLEEARATLGLVV